jgi:hypothetical protein
MVGKLLICKDFGDEKKVGVDGCRHLEGAARGKMGGDADLERGSS